MEASYWERITQSRLSRRRVLKGTAALGAGAAALSLVGCGGGGGDEGAKNVITDPDAIIYSWQWPDETKEAVAGGVYDTSTTSDITGTLDPMVSPSFTTVDTMAIVYDVLLRANSGPGIEPRSDEGRKIIGNVAEKYEVSSDAVSYTLKLRPNVKFHNVPPVNGRAMDVEDWKTSWERYMASSPFQATITEMVDKIDTPDSKTMVIKLREPNVAFLRLLTAARSSVLILPKELNADPKLAETKPIGSKWMILDKIQPSVTREYKRHEEYWDGKPFIERWHFPIIPEYANRYAQFITGHIHNFTPRQTDVLQLRKDVSKARMLKGDPSGQLLSNFFGYTELETAPWKDARVRQAMRMSVDWDAIRAYFSNSADFEKAGIPIESRMPTHISGGGIVDSLYWLDPQKNELGDASKFFLFNLAEAKKLMEAAGYKEPVEIEGFQHNGAQYGSIYQEQGDLTVDGWNKSGLFKAKMTRLAYPQFLDQCYQKRDFKGVAVQQYDFVYNETDLNLFNWYHSKGGRFHWVKGDTKLDDMIMKQRREIDAEKRTTIIHDIQKYMATVMGRMPGDGTSGGYGFQWPAVRNSAWPAYKTWLDKTKAPYA